MTTNKPTQLRSPGPAQAHTARSPELTLERRFANMPAKAWKVIQEVCSQHSFTNQSQLTKDST